MTLIQGAIVVMPVSTETAEHYIWGDHCDGWHLLKRNDLSIIQERVPAGGTEIMHFHTTARQFFYVLEGQGTMRFEDRTITLEKGQGVEIEPKIRHQFKNQSNADVHFLVISVPPTRRDRTNVIAADDAASATAHTV
jgi:mannose-6-phosphate isomerase-like protein (cupin superfamily)